LRERDVLQLLLTGKSNQEIARCLYISEKTVKNHLTHIFSELNVKSRSELMARMRSLP